MADVSRFPQGVLAAVNSTTQIGANGPAQGTIGYDTVTNQIAWYDGIVWQFLGGGGVSFEPVIVTGNPNSDPNGVFDSLVVHGDGDVTVALNNSISVDGISEGACWELADPTGWVDDGSLIVIFRLTFTSLVAGNANYWAALGAIDGGGTVGAASRGLSGGIRQNVASDYLAWDCNLLTGSFAGVPAATTAPIVQQTVWTPGGAISAGADLGSIASRIPATGQLTDRIQGASTGGAGFVFCAGCANNTNNGPHSARMTLEYGILDISAN